MLCGQLSFRCWMVFLLSGFVVAGCGENTAPPEASSPDTQKVEQSQYVLDTKPAGAVGVISLREKAEDGADAVVVGRIGGSETPWIEGSAAFTIVDPSLKACSDIPGDNCPKPWDYCCETDKLPTATLLVKIVDEGGKPLKTDARELLSVQELDTVIVQGEVQRDETGGFAVLAKGVFVKR